MNDKPHESSASISDVNRASWSTHDAARAYENADYLFKVERAILNQFRDEMPNWRVLDIGVGGGRTTTYLSPRCREYIGIDYSEDMLRSAQRRFPDTDFRQMDARDLSAFADNTFDFVMFSYNGIDYVQTKDRITVLQEVFRILRPGGKFLFSSHNKDVIVLHRSNIRYALSYLGTKEGILSVLAFLKGLPKSISNRRKLKSYERDEKDHGYVNEPEGSFSFVTYYVSAPLQIRQLTDAGFGQVEAYGLNGRRIALETEKPRDFMIHYLAEAA